MHESDFFRQFLDKWIGEDENGSPHARNVCIMSTIWTGQQRIDPSPASHRRTYRSTGLEITGCEQQTF